MKKIFVFLWILSLMGALVLPSAAETPDSGTINSAALNYFTGIVNKLPANTDYVIFRTGDYTASMIYGYKFVVDGNDISSSEVCRRCDYNTRGTGDGNYNYNPTVENSQQTGFSLTVNKSSIIYSSVGSYPSVGEASRDNISYILWTVVFLVLIFIVFKFFRNRRHYINL